MNLLQETWGAAGVFPSDAPLVEYLRTVHLDWEFLPVGQRDAALAQILRDRDVPRQVRERILQRYDVLTSLKPQQMFIGTSGIARYIAAQFADDLVVFENLDYGNS